FAETDVVFVHEGAAVVYALAVDECAGACAEVVEYVGFVFFQEDFGVVGAYLVNLVCFQAEIAVAGAPDSDACGIKLLCLTFAGSVIKYKMTSWVFQVAHGSW